MKRLLIMSIKIFLWTVFTVALIPNSYAKTVTYLYDEYSQLKEARYEEQASITYDYDSIGNRLNRTVLTMMTPTEFSVEVQTDSGTPLTDLKVHAFKDSGSYTGTFSTTDENGKALFLPENFEQGIYKFRVDYLGSQFWSDPVLLPGISNLKVIIEEGNTQISVTVGGNPVEDIKVYLFSESSSYLGSYQKTDIDGKVYFTLPSGRTFLFRADYMGNKYWSQPVAVSGDTPVLVTLATGGGTLQVTLQKDQDNPLSGQPLYLFSESGSYLGNKIVSDENGNASFYVSAGEYKIRADYMGCQFWSDLIPVSDNTSFDLIVPHKDVNVTVRGDYNGDLKPKEAISSYLFSSNNTYIGIKRQTDSNGSIILNLPEQPYKVRFDYLAMQFWTEPFTWTDSVVSIEEGLADIRVTNMGEPLIGIKVYLFSQTGSYCNINVVTDENGIAQFRLPQGTWNFRADYMGSQYWSGEKSIVSHISNPVELSTGGGNLSLTVQEDALTPLANISCYLFSESGSYLNKSGATSDQGTIELNLSDGIYKIRMDYLGYQFWTPIFTIPQDTYLSFNIPHKNIKLKVQSNFNGDIKPKENLKAYLFTPLDSYLGEQKETDAQGEVLFHLPEKEYKFRVDYMSQKYWSGIVTGADTTVTIEEGMAQIVVKQGQTPLENVKVHLFSENDTYLGVYQLTDISGIASFRLPQGTYKFRADHMNAQYWATQAITAHDTTLVPINTGGGSFVLSVNKSSDTPLAGTSVYLFNSTGSYLGISSQSNDQGIVSFDLSDGNFKFRADHLGYQFWTDTFLVPDTLSGTLTIPHQNVTISVRQVYESTSLPVESCKIYLFNESGSYLGLFGTTDSQGEFCFNVPFESYKARVDYLGQQYWSGALLWSDQAVEINHGLVKVHATSRGVDVENASVYLFTENSSYLQQSVKTDISGKAEFLIPEGSYKFRVDYNGVQHWSNAVQIAANGQIIVEVEDN